MSRISVLSANSTARRGYLAEHGLSLLVEHRGARVLFDTGQGLVLAPNARKAGQTLESLTAVVLSHGHYDHGGGLALIDGGAGTPLHAVGAGFHRRYSRQQTRVAEVGLGGECLPHSLRHVESDAPRQIADGIWITGPLQPSFCEEADRGPFLADHGDGPVPDDFRDEQALFIERSSDVVLLSGCAHTGIVSAVSRVRELASKPVSLVMGGFHLGSVRPDRLAWTLDRFEEFEIDFLFPMHCTGDAATRAIAARFADRVETPGTGIAVEWEDGAAGNAVRLANL